MNAGHKIDGSYVINPTLIPSRQFFVYCKFELDTGQAWNVIQRRVDGEVDFNRTWVEYENGFGMLHGSFWLGLRKVHDLTLGSGKKARLHIDLKANRGSVREKFAEYGEFAVGNNIDKYKLHLAYYDARSTAGDSLIGTSANLNGMKFTTIDQDNDLHTHINCAIRFTGGWWFNKCHSANLNGLYPPESLVINDCSDWVSYAKYLTWTSFNACFGEIVFSEMRIRSD